MFIEYYQIGMILFSLIILYIVSLIQCSNKFYFAGLSDGAFQASLRMGLELDAAKLVSFTKNGLMVPYNEELKLTETDIQQIKKILNE
jgi:hypothetical protein